MTRLHARGRVAAGLSLVTALGVTGTAGVLTAPAFASDSGVVISEVYGGGGNSGATYKNDFVELTNAGTSTVAVGGWSVAYFAAGGNAGGTTALPAGTMLAPGQIVVVQEAAGANTAASALPCTPVATGAINMSGTSGRVDLLNGSTLIDRVGYGTATTFEGTAAAPATTNTTSASRDKVATDTNSNSADFAAETPSPCAASTRNPSTGGGGTGPTTGLKIHDIQGASQVSPYKGSSVSGVAGIVTALFKGSFSSAHRGFFMQETDPDTNDSTSEALFVDTGSTNPVNAVGDSVTVAGTVTEFSFTPGASLALTELTSSTVTTISSGNALPAATQVGTSTAGVAGRMPPTAAIDTYSGTSQESVESPSHVFDPTKNGIDFWESLEGMRVTISNSSAVGPTDVGFGETPVVPGGITGAGLYTPRGGVISTATDSNPERMTLKGDILKDGGLAGVPIAKVGDTYTGDDTGISIYDFDLPYLELTATPALTPHTLAQEIAVTPSANHLTIASFNVENLAPQNPQSKFDQLASLVVNNLKSPDILGLEEIQDNSGATDNDNVVASDVTQKMLHDAIVAKGGPDYSARSIDPVADQDGGQPGGNIRQVFFYRTDTGVSFVDRPAPSSPSTTADSVVNTDGVPSLQYSPGRLSPGDSAWNSSRKPLAGQFSYNGRTFFAILNHWNSKGGDQALYGVNQPPAQSSQTQRNKQAAIVAAFVTSILNVDPNAPIAVLGDFNDYSYSTPVQQLLTAGLTDEVSTLPATEQYTYDYEGNSQILDHIFTSKGFNTAADAGYDVIHVNSEYPTPNADGSCSAPAGTPCQASDHEPSIFTAALGTTAAPAPGAPTAVGAVAGDTKARVSWTAPSGTVTGYVVTETTGDMVGKTFAVTAPASSLDVTGLVDGTSYTFTVTATNAGSAGPASAASNAVVPRVVDGEYTALTPARLFDSRSSGGKVGAGVANQVTVAVLGHGGVPASGVRAVVVNVTAVGASGYTFISALPAPATGTPTTSNINLPPNGLQATQVTVPVNSDGSITLYNDQGSVDLIADVEGYYSDDSGFAASRVHLLTPTRLADTRDGTGVAASGPVQENSTVVIPVAGHAGVPSSGATAVLLNLTGVDATQSTYLTAYAGGTPTGTSTLNPNDGYGIANLVTVPLADDGSITVYNAKGSTDVIADVLGYTSVPSDATGSRFVAVTPSRSLDTRSNTGTTNGRAQAGAPVEFPSGAPAGATGVVLGVALVVPNTVAYLAVGPAGSPTGSNSTVNGLAGTITANGAVTPVGPGGGVRVSLSDGSSDVIADLEGYFTA